MENLKEDELIFIKILVNDEINRLNLLKEKSFIKDAFDDRIEALKQIYSKINK